MKTIKKTKSKRETLAQKVKRLKYEAELREAKKWAEYIYILEKSDGGLILYEKRYL